MKDDLVYLQHIDEAINRILAFTSAGESAKKVSAGTRAAHPDVPWKSMKNHLPLLQKQVARLLL